MLAIVTSHPIQYQAPLWRELARDGRVRFEVWFLTPHAVAASHDREFQKTFAWDIDLLNGYPLRFLDVKPGWRLDRFDGVTLTTPWRTLLSSHQVTTIWMEGWRFRTQWLAVSAARALGVRVWLRGENNDLAPESAWKRALRHVALGWYFRRVDRFLCIGAANRRFYRKFGVADHQEVTTPYCVDNVRFSAAAAALRPRRDEIRAGLKIPPESKTILFCGKLIPKKRPFDVLTAARIVMKTESSPYHLLYVGDGELGPALRRAASEPGAPKVTFTGFLNQSEISRAFAAADCLVLPSDYGETWGLVVNEALASGVPTIVSDRCGCAEDLGVPQGHHHVYRCGDIPALAASIISVIQNPPSADRISEIIATHAPARTIETVAKLGNRSYD